MAKFNFKEIGKRVGVRVLAVAAGGGAAYGFNKALPNLDPKWSAGIKMGLGILLPEIAPKKALLTEGGAGLAAVGAYEMANILLSGSTSVKGVGDPEYKVGDGDYQVKGNDNALGDPDDIMSGNDNAMGGYEVN